MSYSGRGRYDSYSPPRGNRSLSRSYSRSRSRSRSRDSVDVANPGNNLYVTGLSPRITKRDLEDHFSREGKAKRKRGRTPTPGKYLGVRPTRVRDYDRRRTYSRSSDFHSSRRSPSYSPYRGDRYGSPRYSPYDDRSYGRDRSVTPYRRRDRSYSPYGRRDRSRSPYSRRDRSLSPYSRRERSISPYSRRERSISPYSRRERSLSPYDRRNGALRRGRERSVSSKGSPYRGSNRP